MARRRRYEARPPLVPDWVPPAAVANLPGRGEVFYRLHTGGEQGAVPLLLLHGWTATADLQWVTCYQAVGARHPFVAVDHRGHGRGLRSDEAFRLEDAADDAAALLRQLGIGPVVVVGYSMGGPITLLLAQRHPDLVRGVVLEATALEWHDTWRDRASWWFLSMFESVLRSRLTARASRRFLRQLLAEADPALADHVDWLVAESGRGDPHALADAGRALRDYDARPFAPGLGVPAAVVLTTRDRLVRPVKQRALAAALSADVVEVDGDHLVFWEDAGSFREATLWALDKVVSRAAVR